MDKFTASRLVAVSLATAWVCAWGIQSEAREFPASPLFESDRRLAQTAPKYLGKGDVTRIKAMLGRPAPTLVYALDRDEVAEACGIRLDAQPPSLMPVQRYDWTRKGVDGVATASGTFVYTVFEERNDALGKFLERLPWVSPMGMPPIPGRARETRPSPSGIRYGDIAFWSGPIVSYVSANVYASIGVSGAVSIENEKLLEEVLADFDGYVRQQLAEQNTRAQLILRKFGVTARVALDDEGVLSVSGEVVCLSSDFPRHQTSLRVQEPGGNWATRKLKTTVVETEPIEEIQGTRMYRHVFSTGAYRAPKGVEKGTLRLAFWRDDGLVFGNRWHIDFNRSGVRKSPASPLFELDSTSVASVRDLLGKRDWTRIEAMRGKPAPALMYGLDRDEVAKACGIQFDARSIVKPPQRYEWPRKDAQSSVRPVHRYDWTRKGVNGATAKGSIEYAVFKNRNAALGRFLERLQLAAPSCLPPVPGKARESGLSPSGIQYGDIALWDEARVWYVSANVCATITVDKEDTGLLEEVFAAFDTYVKQQLAGQNALAQAILKNLGVTPQIALDDEGVFWVWGAVVNASSRFPRYWAVLSLPKTEKSVDLVQRWMSSIVIEGTTFTDMEPPRTYRHAFGGWRYPIPKGVEKGTLELVLKGEDGRIFGNRWHLDFATPNEKDESREDTDAQEALEGAADSAVNEPGEGTIPVEESYGWGLPAMLVGGIVAAGIWLLLRRRRKASRDSH